MKNFVFIYLIFFASIINSQSFVDPKNTWTVDERDTGLPPVTKKYFFTSDSLEIDGKYYHQLHSSCPGCINPDEIKKLNQYYRQEGKKVWKKYNMSDKEHLVYDFGVSKGDTFNLINFSINNKSEIVVDKKIIKMKDDSERNLFTNRCFYNENDTSQFTSWIEGIGNINYPFTSESNCSLFDPSTTAQFICFSYDDKLIYENESYLNCSEKKEKLKFIDGKSLWIHRFSGFGPEIGSSRSKFSEEAKVINEKKYYNLLSSSNETGDDFKATTEYYREEGSKVYHYENGKDVLIYDFNIQLGDSFDIGFIGSEKRKMTVYKISTSVYSDGLRRKHIYFHCPFSNDPWHEWIEGIGSINSTYYCLLDVGESLSCYFYNDNLVKNFLNGDCWLVSTKDEVTNSISLFPNPTSSFIELKGIDDLLIEKVEIYDQIGRRIDYHFSLKENKIDVAHLSNGLYHLQLITKNNTLINKMFVKM